MDRGGTYHHWSSNPSWLQVDHEVVDDYVTWTASSSYYFSGTRCERKTESHEYTTYQYNCDSSPGSYSSDSGLQCVPYTAYGLFIRSGYSSGPLCLYSCNNSCSVPPAAGFYTNNAETSLTFVLGCQEAYWGKLLHIEADAFYPSSVSIGSAAPPTGGEFLINGVAPSSIYQYSLIYNSCQNSYMWNGTLEWDIPIKAKCGEKITLIPSVQNGLGDADLSYIKLASVMGIEIVKPVNNDDFDLTQTNHTATPPINYQAHVIPVGGASAVDWSVNVQYRTSGGKCNSCDVTQTFQSAPDVDYTKTHSSMGGQVTVNASAVIQGETVTAEPVIYTITGVAIPPNEITNQLVSLYTGTTKRLMTGLAMKESTYMQFSQRTLYGVTDLWPRESYDGGSHIGLMQVATTMDRAWNWQKNTEFEVNFYQGTNTQLGQKMGFALLWEGKIKNEAKSNYKCQLRNLTGLERENMALLLYNGEKPADQITGQYYYYQVKTTNGKTTCDWVKNTQGNPAGVAYTDDVRAKMQ